MTDPTPDPDLVRSLQRILALHRQATHYTATAYRCFDYWEIEIDGIGTIEADLDAHHRDVILNHVRDLGRDTGHAHLFIYYPQEHTP